MLNLNDPAYEWNLEEGQFDIALGFLDFAAADKEILFKPKELPPQVGRWRVETLRKEGAKFTSEEVEDASHLCSFENDFKLYDKDQKRAKDLVEIFEKSTCFDGSKLSLQGSALSQTTKSFLITFEFCDGAERDDCLSFEEQVDFFVAKSLMIAYSSTYVNFSDFERPIHS